MKKNITFFITGVMAITFLFSISAFAEDYVSEEILYEGYLEEDRTDEHNLYDLSQDQPENAMSNQKKEDEEKYGEDNGLVFSDFNNTAEIEEILANDWEDAIEDDFGEEAVYASSEIGLTVVYHSEDEIRQFINSHPTRYYNSVYKIKPSSKAPYILGELSDETLKYGLNAVNQARFIAGLSTDISLDPNYNKKAQAAALINAYYNNGCNHYPAQPADMDNDLFDLAADGASSSNLHWGSDNIADSVKGFMSDSSSYEANYKNVGHRRWILNPVLAKMGIGVVDKNIALYLFDRSQPYRGYTGDIVAWPAQMMPADYFYATDSWSVSVGDQLDISAVSVELVRKRDGEKWFFSSNASDGFFNVDNSGMGQIGCIIFRPDSFSFSAGDVFDVKIFGAKQQTIHYTVTFFDVCGGNHDYDTDIREEASCVNTGYRIMTCNRCGNSYGEFMNRVAHSWSAWNVTNKPTCGEEGIQERSCTVCGKKETEKVPATGNHTQGEITHSTYRKGCILTVVDYTICKDCGAKYDEKTYETESHKPGLFTA